MKSVFDKYKQTFDKFVSLDSTEWDYFKSKTTIHQYVKGDIIHHAGDINTYLYFINSGIVRVFVVDDDGNDFTWSLSFNDNHNIINNIFLVDYDSFVNSTKSKLSFEVLETCELISIEQKDIQDLYNISKSGERFGRLMAENAYSQAHNLILDRLTKTATTRYKELLETTPYLLKKVPQYHIATLLGITPQSLSRIKKEITLCE